MKVLVKVRGYFVDERQKSSNYSKKRSYDIFFLQENGIIPSKGGERTMENLDIIDKMNQCITFAISILSAGFIERKTNIWIRMYFGCECMRRVSFGKKQ